MEIATFLSYSNEYYMFDLENIGKMAFEEVHPKVLYQYNLREDLDLVGEKFELIFKEEYLENEDLTIYKVESLKLL